MCSCSKDDEPGNSGLMNENNSSVTINADGSTSTGVAFSKIDDNTFFLDYIKYKIVDSHLEIVGYDDIEIAKDVKPYAAVNINGTNYNTRSIAWNALSGCIMETFTIPNTITGIRSLGYFKNLREVIVPSSVTYIGDFTFTDCPKLKALYLPSSVREFDWLAFDDDIEIYLIGNPSDFSIDLYISSNFPTAITPSNIYEYYNECKWLRNLHVVTEFPK